MSSSNTPAGPEQGQSKDAVPDPSERTVSGSCVPRRKAGMKRSWLPTEGCAEPQTGPYGDRCRAPGSAAVGFWMVLRTKDWSHAFYSRTPASSESSSTSCLHLITGDIKWRSGTAPLAEIAVKHRYAISCCKIGTVQSAGSVGPTAHGLSPACCALLWPASWMLSRRLLCHCQCRAGLPRMHCLTAHGPTLERCASQCLAHGRAKRVYSEMTPGLGGDRSHGPVQESPEAHLCCRAMPQTFVPQASCP